MSLRRGILAALAIEAAAIALASRLLAHEAPSGWSYDPECCHTMDCAPVPESAVEEATGGYAVRLLPGDHPMVTRPLAGFLAHGSPMLRPSGDGDKHVCTDGRRIICVYVPPGGV